MTRRKIQYWVIAPDADAEFAANMEEVLDTYAEPYDANYPVLCMDEQPVQLLKETRVPIPASMNHARRVDYEYERAGTASIFMFCEPLNGWRSVNARKQRTKVDWALEMRSLIETRYADAEKIILVCDNLNTHTKGAFYAAFPAEEARRLVRRFEFRYTPKHGSCRALDGIVQLCGLDPLLDGHKEQQERTGKGFARGLLKADGSALTPGEFILIDQKQNACGGNTYHFKYSLFDSLGAIAGSRKISVIHYSNIK